MATSTPWSTSTLPAPSLRNATGVELTIALQHTLAPVGCERIPLAPGDFAAAQFHALDDGEHVTLDEAHRSQDTGAAGESGAPSFGGGDCGAVTITAAKLAPTIVRWDLRDVSSPPNLDAAEDVAPGTVYVEQFGSELHLALGDGMSATPLEAPP